MKDNEIKIFDELDFQGILSATLTDDDNKQGGGQMDEIKAKGLANWGIVEFTDKEIDTMPKTFKRLILLQKKQCHLRTRKSGNSGITYEIRFRRDGYDIHACGKTIEKAKANFIEKLKTAKPCETKKGNGTTATPTTFTAFALYHFENFKKVKVSQKHYENSILLFNRYLSPRFKETPIKNITPSDCKKLFDEINEQGKGKTAEDLRSMLNGIFKTAIAHGITERNPISLIVYIKHERENGQALSRDEETALLKALKGSIYEIATALALYCGLRPNELKTAKIQGNFIKAVNSKRKGGKVEYKLIPIINRLRPFLPADGVFDIPNLDMLRREIKKALQGHKLYDLRTTFYTRCDEMGVSPPARDEYVGHSNGTLTNTYRDLSEEYLLKEGAKLNAW